MIPEFTGRTCHLHVCSEQLNKTCTFGTNCLPVVGNVKISKCQKNSGKNLSFAVISWPCIAVMLKSKIHNGSIQESIILVVAQQCKSETRTQITWVCIRKNVATYNNHLL